VGLLQIKIRHLLQISSNPFFFNKRNVQNLLVISGGKDFSFNQKTSFGIAENLMKSEIFNLIVQDEFFREALVHPQLKTLAIEIQSKISRAEKDSSFEYPQFEKDENIKELYNKAKEFNIKSDYADALLGDKQYKPDDGVLIRYFPNHSNYLKQWFFANFWLFFILFITIYFLKNNLQLIPYKHEGLIILFFFVNIFSIIKKPNNISVSYMVGGVFLSLIMLALVLYYVKFIEGKRQRKLEYKADNLPTEVLNKLDDLKGDSQLIKDSQLLIIDKLNQGFEKLSFILQYLTEDQKSAIKEINSNLDELDNKFAEKEWVKQDFQNQISVLLEKIDHSNLKIEEKSTAKDLINNPDLSLKHKLKLTIPEI